MDGFKYERDLKRSDFYKSIISLCKHNKRFSIKYKKVNGEIRIAEGKLYDKDAIKEVKGTGFNRDQKMKEWNVFQYFDINSHAWRSAKLENIIHIEIGNKRYILKEDEE